MEEYNKELYRVRAVYDGTYKIYLVMAVDEAEAKEVYERSIDTAKEYEILSVTKAETNGLIVKKGITPNGIQLQIEDWNHLYKCISKNSTIGFYPVAKRDVFHEKNLPPYPQRNKTFRSELQFEDESSAKKAFVSLVTGTKEFHDYLDCYSNSALSKEEYLEAIS